MLKQLVLGLAATFCLVGCTVSSRIRVDSEPLARSTTSAVPLLAVTKPALCNDYPVEYRKSGSASEITMATIDFWFLSGKPKTCTDQPTVEERSKERRWFRRPWK